MIELLLSLGFLLSQETTSKTQTDSILATMVHPSEVPGVPRNVTEELERKGCLIPIVNYYGTKYQNIIHGEFAAAKQRDWAALCFRDPQNSIVVIWGGKHTCAAELQ